MPAAVAIDKEWETKRQMENKAREKQKINKEKSFSK